MPEKLKTISEVLLHQSEYKWSDALYADRHNVANPSSTCLVLDPDGVETDDEEDPLEARVHGFGYILSIQDIQSVYANLKQ